MQILGQAVFAFFLLVGWLMIPLGLPGTAVLFFDGLIYGLATKTIGWKLLLGLFLLSAAAETGDNVLSLYGAKKFGTTKKGMWASFLGGIAGAIAGGAVMGLLGGFVLSLVLGAIGSLAGAFAGGYFTVYWIETKQGRTKEEARHAAKGAVLGRLAGIALRFAIALVMTWLLVKAVFLQGL